MRDDGIDSSVQVSDLHREHVSARLRSNLMAWLTTVDANGKPHSVPVWFLQLPDGRILVYSERAKQKLANIAANPNVCLGLDVTDLGRDVVRIEGTAKIDTTIALAENNDEYRAKYIERIGALFGDAIEFSKRFSVPIVISAERLIA